MREWEERMVRRRAKNGWRRRRTRRRGSKLRGRVWNKRRRRERIVGVRER